MNGSFSPNKYFATVVQAAVYICLAVMLYSLFRREAYGLLPSDLPDHLSILVDWVNANQYIPHPVFHMSVYGLALLTGKNIADTTPIVLTVATLLTLLVSQKLLSEKSGPLLLLLAVSTIFATAVYLPVYSHSVEAFSPNKWHNPTMLLLKPLALLAFYLFVRAQDPTGARQKIFFAAGAALLLLSTATKPSFAIVFIPAVILHLLLCRRHEYRQLPATILFAAPAVLLLAYQYVRTYQSSGTGSYFHDKIIFTFFGVMQCCSANIIISNLLLLAFPLALLIVARSRVARNPYLTLAWITTFVAFLQAAFLAEQQKFDQGAFGVGYVISLFILYFFSVKEALSWFQQSSTDIAASGKVAVVGIYLLHLVSGIYYVSTLLLG